MKLRPAFAAFAAFAVLGAGRPVPTAAAAPEKEQPSEIASVFFISKSENRNQVHYAVLVDGQCAPAGAAPVRGYWRDLEKGPTATSPLLDREQRAYGIATQSVTRRADSGGDVTLSLRALPKRTLTITTGKNTAGECAAWAYMDIQNEPAQLYNIHAVLKLLGVDSLIITGWSRADRRIVRETLRM